MVYVKKNATICQICAPEFDKTTCCTFMVCLLICAGSAGYGIAAVLPNASHFHGKKCRYPRIAALYKTVAWPSKCGAHGGRKVAHMAACF